MTPPTTSTTTWHAEDDLLARYAAGTCTPSEALSVEAHVLGCRDCQRHLAGAVDAPTVARTWDLVADRIDTTDSRLTRLLDRLGVPDADGRIVAAAARLHLLWFAALVAIVVAALSLASLGRDGAEATYLVLGPVLPLLGVALAYGPGTDQAWELSQTTPVSQLRLLLVRSAAVLVACLPVAAAAGLLLDAGPAVPASLLPGLALVSISLALSARVTPLTTAATLGPAWVLVAGASFVLRPDHITAAVGDAAIYRPAVQLGFALVATVALASLWLRPAASPLREDLP